MITFNEYLKEEKLPTNLKPSLFLGNKETWESLEEYKNDLHRGIDNLKNELFWGIIKSSFLIQRW